MRDTREVVERAIDGSICFSAFAGDPGRVRDLAPEILQDPRGRARQACLDEVGRPGIATVIRGKTVHVNAVNRRHCPCELIDPAVFVRRTRSEEHTSELQSLTNLVCRLLL